MAPIVIDGKARTQLWIFPREERRHFALEADPLIQLLENVLNPRVWEALKQKKNSYGVVTLRDLDAMGFSTKFSESDLEISLEIPLKMRRSQNVDIVYDEFAESKLLRPSLHSGYLNLRSNQPFRYGDNQGTNEKLPLNLKMDLVENIGGVVLEGGAEYLEKRENLWTRQDTRLVWDSENTMTRWMLGDFNSSPRGFQQSASMAGLSVSKEFSIQPYNTAKPLGHSEILIKRSSMVEIYVNGVLYSQVRLNPGRFNIKDFPIANGQNNVKVKIKDDLGQEETFDFSILYENTLLVAGQQEFAYYVGSPWRPSGGDRAYSQNELLTSFFHRMGLSDIFTTGLNYQNYLSQGLLGLELSFMTPLGFVSMDGAYSRTSPNQYGYGQRYKYRSLDKWLGEDTRTTLTLEHEYRDINFNPVSLLPFGSPAFATRSDAQISRRFSEMLFVGVGGTYETYHLQPEDGKTYRVNVVLPWTSQFRMEASYSKSVGPVNEDRGFVSLFWSDRPGIYSVSAYHDSKNHISQVGVNRNSVKRYDDYRVGASWQNSKDSNFVNVNAAYLAQPAEFRFENNSFQSVDHNYNVASFGLNTGIAWVGTEWSLSQPINDSFALIAGHNQPADHEMSINPNGLYDEARLGPRRTTVLNQYTSYYKYAINLDSTSLPMGYLLSKEFFNIHPTYKSGLLIPVHFFSRVMVKGKLFYANGNAATYLVGDIYDSQGRLVDNHFFTNKDGVFVIEGLEPGNYKIHTNRPQTGAIDLNVQASENNLMVIEKLVAPGIQEEQ